MNESPDYDPSQAPRHEGTAPWGKSRIPERTYPGAWELEPASNGPGCRTWFYISRWVSRTRVEFLNGIDGKPECFRTKPEALAAIAKAAGSTTT